MGVSVGRRFITAAICGAGLLLAACQAGMPPGAGGAPTGTGQLATAPPPPNAKSVPPPSPTSGLSSYKVYNTTEKLCDRTCKAEARCVRHSFEPISEINGYIAGQCQLYARS
jgi:hypothetical protein